MLACRLIKISLDFVSLGMEYLLVYATVLNSKHSRGVITQTLKYQTKTRQQVHLYLYST